MDTKNPAFPDRKKTLSTVSSGVSKSAAGGRASVQGRVPLVTTSGVLPDAPQRRAQRRAQRPASAPLTSLGAVGVGGPYGREGAVRHGPLTSRAHPTSAGLDVPTLSLGNTPLEVGDTLGTPGGIRSKRGSDMPVRGTVENPAEEVRRMLPVKFKGSSRGYSNLTTAAAVEGRRPLKMSSTATSSKELISLRGSQTDASTSATGSSALGRPQSSTMEDLVRPPASKRSIPPATPVHVRHRAQPRAGPPSLQSHKQLPARRAAVSVSGVLPKGGAQGV